MANYPMNSMYFTLQWGGTQIGFTEISGLNMEVDVLEYRNGASPQFSAVKMPGKISYDNVVITRGIFPNDNEFYEWFATTKNLNSPERRDIVISLLNQNHEPVMFWKFKNAFPVKYIGPVLRSDGAVATESLVLTHEGMVVDVMK